MFKALSQIGQAAGTTRLQERRTSMDSAIDETRDSPSLGPRRGSLGSPLMRDSEQAKLVREAKRSQRKKKKARPALATRGSVEAIPAPRPPPPSSTPAPAPSVTTETSGTLSSDEDTSTELNTALEEQLRESMNAVFDCATEDDLSSQEADVFLPSPRPDAPPPLPARVARASRAHAPLAPSQSQCAPPVPPQERAAARPSLSSLEIPPDALVDASVEQVEDALAALQAFSFEGAKSAN